MKSCPSCLFLIDDDQEICDSCRPREASAIPPITIGPSASATAVLDRPAAVAAPEDVSRLRYRSTRHFVSLKGIVIAVLVLALGGALGSAAGYGPLAAKFASWNLTINRPEAFPQTWDHLDDLASLFEVDLPGGSHSVFEPLNPSDDSQGGLVGKAVTTVRGAEMQVAWSNFGISQSAMDTYDSSKGVQDLLGRYAALRIPGEMTVARPVMLPIGQAVDAVFVKNDSTTRVRMVITPKEAFILSTSGPDSDTEALDAAHQRLLKSFQPKL